MDMILGDGPMITGTWYNPKTGHRFTAKDTYLEDDKLFVLTTDGQRLDYNMLSQYVQSNRPEEDARDFTQRQPQSASAVLPPEVAAAILPPEGAAPEPPANFDDSLLTPEDRALIAGNNAPANSGTAVPTQAPGLGNIHQQEDEDDLLVRRLLKRTVGPIIDCNIRFEKFPQEQLHMLEMMGVDPEKIANYYMKDVTLANIQEIIRASLIEVIEKMMAEPVKHTFTKIAEPAILTAEQSKELGLDSLESLIPEAQINEKEKSATKKAPAKTVKKTAAKKKTTAKKTTKK